MLLNASPPKLVVERTGPEPDPRRVEVLMPLGTHPGVSVHNSNVCNSLTAVLERVFFVKINGEYQPPPQPEDGVFRRKCRRFFEKFRHRLSAPNSWSMTQVVESYKGRKREVYQRAKEEVVRWAGLPPRAENIDAFVKVEKLVDSGIPYYGCSSGEYKSARDRVPRVISPRKPTYGVMLACYTKPIEHCIFAVIDSIYGRRTVMKGLNAERRGREFADAWKRFKDPVAIGVDATRFDQHVSVEALLFEFSFYLLCFQGDELLRFLLFLQLETKGVFRVKDGRVKYSTKGGRCSGDMNTSLGNVIIMCALMWTYLMSLRLIKFEFKNDGDDGVIIIEREDLPKLAGARDWFLRFGFQMKIEEAVDVLERVEFCQSQPVLCSRGYVMVRNPHVSMTKDVANVRPTQSENEWNELRCAIGDCGLALAGDLPILGEYYAAMKRGATFRKTKIEREFTGMDYLALGCHGAYAPPSEDSRYSFWLAFGIDPDTQSGIEQDLRGCTITYQTPRVVDAFAYQEWLTC